LQRGILPRFGHRINLVVPEVPDARCESKPQHVARSEHLISEAGGVRVMLLDPQVGVMTEEAVQHVQRIAHGGVDHLRVEWAVLIRYMRVERDRWIAPVLGVDGGGCRSAG